MNHPFKRGVRSPKKHSLYYIWNNIIQYISNPNNPNYHLYGAKGIGIDREWYNDYNKFLLWAIKNGYNKDFKLTRINKNKHFEPNNCYWKGK